MIVAKAFRSITAPMKFPKSAGSPTRISAICSSSRFFTAGQSETGMKAREAAEHFWPWYSKAPRVSAVARAPTSAEGWARTKFLPPVSPTILG